MGTVTPGHVLYVEDNPGDFELLAQAVAESKSDLVLHHVPNAVQAFSFLGNQPPFMDAPKPDLVLLDVNLPVIDGLKALDLIMGTTAWANIPIMMLTSSQRQQERERATHLGAADFLTKPIEWDGYLRLAAKLAQYVEARHALQRRLTGNGGDLDGGRR